MNINPKYGISPQKDNYDLDNIFTHHELCKEQLKNVQELRTLSKELAKLIMNKCPVSRERSIALTKLEESLFWVNAGIARN